MSGKKRFYRNKLAFFLPSIYLIFSIPVIILEINPEYIYHNLLILWQIFGILATPFQLFSLPMTLAFLIIFNCPLFTPDKTCDRIFRAMPIIGAVFYLIVGLAIDCYRHLKEKKGITLQQEKTISADISSQEQIPTLKDKQSQFRNKTLKLLIILILGTSIVGVVLYLIVNFRKQLPQKKTVNTDEITTQPSLELPKNFSKIQTGKIAYVKDGNLFIVDNSGVKQVTTTRNVGKIKWSRDGKYIGWISQKEFHYKNPSGYEWTRGFGISLSYLPPFIDSAIEAIKERYSDEVLQSSEGFKLSLSGFDFSNDSKKIVYVRNGVWLYDRSTDKEEKIADNYLGDADSPVDDRTYVDVDWNPKSDIILLYQGVWECGRTQLYNLQTKQIEEIDIRTCGRGIWSADGKYIIGYNASGRDEGGLWVTSIKDKSTRKIVDDGKYGLSVISAAVFNDNQIAAIIEPFPSPDSETNLPIKGSAIYLVSLDSALTPIRKLEKIQDEYFTKEGWGLDWSPDGKQIALLYRTYDHREKKEQFDLHILNRDGSDMALLVAGISSYQWSPVGLED